MPRRQGTTTERGLGAAHQADKKRLLAALRDGEPCWRCGQPMYRSQKLERDHIIDRVNGGAHGPAVLAHQHCNRSAGGKLGAQLRPFPSTNFTAPPPTCKTCGQSYYRPARICEICTAHYHPTYSGGQRTCSRQCGWELRRRNRGTRPVGDRVRSASIVATVSPPWRTSREWLVPAGRTYGKPSACLIYIRECVWCSGLFAGRVANQRACSMACGRRHNWAKSNAARRVTEHTCPCGVTIQPHRRKCDDCISLQVRSHKAECRHEGCPQGANRTGRLCSRHYLDALPPGRG